ncbi:poly(3-hydroxybutyrate) depolymerase [Lysobacter sp. Root96]|nr:poly(3-hydroxybutyrate) depolymerase [Lysobacter sp. Root96]
MARFALSKLWGRMVKALVPVDGRGPRGEGWWPFVREPYSGAWQNDDEWRADSVLAHHAVYGCVTLISNDVGKLRQMLMEQRKDGIWTETSSPAFSPVLRRPNRYQNHIQFKQWWITSKLVKGNTYALKQRDERNVVKHLYVLDPCRVEPLVAPDGEVFYRLNADNLSGVEESGVVVPASEIIHDRMNCLFHPLVGVSPLFAAGAVANIGLKIQKNSSRFFSNDSNPGGILMIPGSIPQDQADALKEKWNANYSGENAGKVAILADGLKFQQLRMSAVESQLIEQLRWTAEVVCSTFHVPPYKIGVGAMPTYNNIEALQQEYYGTCLQTLIEEYEACVDEGLGLEGVKVEGRVLGIELDLDGLIRMDSATQMETLSKSVDGGIRTTNEARRKLDLIPVQGGDVIFRQQQDFPISLLADRNLSPEAPGPTAPANDAPDEGGDEALTDEEMDEDIAA